jgi:hypothetical protein
MISAASRCRTRCWSSRSFISNDLQQWYRLLLRSSSFLNLGLHERIAITLLELATDFGIKDSRGALLAAAFSHQDLADLAGLRGHE